MACQRGKSSHFAIMLLFPCIGNWSFHFLCIKTTLTTVVNIKEAPLLWERSLLYIFLVIDELILFVIPAI